MLELAQREPGRALEEARRLCSRVLARLRPPANARERRAGLLKRVNQLSHAPEGFPERIAAYLRLVATLASAPREASEHDLAIAIRATAELIEWTERRPEGEGRSRPADERVRLILLRLEEDVHETLAAKKPQGVWKREGEILRLIIQLAHLDVVPALQRSRAFVERLLGEAFPEAVGPKCQLHDLLEPLQENRRLLRYADAIRVLGNVASHPWHPEHRDLGPRDVEMAVRLAKEIVRWLSRWDVGREALLESSTSLPWVEPPGLPRATPAPPAPAPPPAEPSRFGRFRVERELGRGGTGVVYLAHDPQLGRPVAIKAVHDAADPAVRKRLQREAHALGRLRHRNVVRIYELSATTNPPFLVMAYVEGESLARLLRQEGPLDPGEAVQLIASVARGVAAAHAEGILHRDIKPANILVRRDERCGLLTDFGVARLTAEAPLTQTGQQVGTIAYMPPEQALGDHDALGPWTDVYALGATLYSALTGRVPFDDQPGAGVDALLHREPTSPSAINRAVPWALDAVVLKCMAKLPERRYADPQALVEALHAVRIAPSRWVPSLLVAGGLGLSLCCVWPALSVVPGSLAARRDLAGEQAVVRPPGRPTRSDPPADLAELRWRAEAGDPRAQLGLGCRYYEGAGVRRSLEQARAWFARAAEGEDSEALVCLGDMLTRGEGGAADFVGAVRCYEEAHRLGAAGGSYGLALMCLEGRGMPRNLAYAETLFYLARERGHPDADEQLARLRELRK